MTENTFIQIMLTRFDSFETPGCLHMERKVLSIVPLFSIQINFVWSQS
jgi:hypothetical protein